ncbi:hypothetical protein [Aquibacillus albus]|uniref:Cysteine-rich CPCC domain-containing protein n=1 Tax=Aquibacillus albus TaxID=1168171 RepID=A0ABS2MVM8_9BACI|nr:hypothetical protein [Aquibacillus albus]MBM7569923.1 hypothetical protein [Aquibacillus albus]
MTYNCVICGYGNLNKAQYNSFGDPTFEICDCCGFESGFDDDDQGYSFATYRDEWLLSGATWFYIDTKPKDWSKKTLIKQLKRIGYDVENKYKVLDLESGSMEIKLK